MRPRTRAWRLRSVVRPKLYVVARVRDVADAGQGRLEQPDDRGEDTLATEAGMREVGVDAPAELRQDAPGGQHAAVFRLGKSVV